MGTDHLAQELTPYKITSSATITREKEVRIEVTIEVTTIKQATILEGEVTRIAIIVVMAIQVNKQVTAVQYIKQVMPQMFNAYYVD